MVFVHFLFLSFETLYARTMCECHQQCAWSFGKRYGTTIEMRLSSNFRLISALHKQLGFCSFSIAPPCNNFTKYSNPLQKKIHFQLCICIHVCICNGKYNLSRIVISYFIHSKLQVLLINLKHVFIIHFLMRTIFKSKFFFFFSFSCPTLC